MDVVQSSVYIGRQTPGTLCGSLIAPVIPLAEVVAIQSTLVSNYVNTPTYPGEYTGLVDPFCNVTLSLTHPGVKDTVWVQVWLPLEDNWNGRYSATGGSGFANGVPGEYPATQIQRGYATSVTDGGLTLNNTVEAQLATWSLREDGSLNYGLLLNLAWRSIHDATVASKALIQQFYGRAPEYSYYSGCSQGGRHGIAAAAKYPKDFDGIVAAAPAIFADKFPVTSFYPQVMMSHSEAPPFCVFEAFQKDIIATCDPLDGATDGLISDIDLIESCPIDWNALVGTEVPCGQGGQTVNITQLYADIVRNSTEGPRYPDGTLMWYGNPPGAFFDPVANTTTLANGTTVPVPALLWMQYLRNFVFQDPTLDVSTLTFENLTYAFEKSMAEIGPVLGNQQYDLAGFEKAGGKMLTWAGLVDNYIPPMGAALYREIVEEQFGGAAAADEFYRVFFAPGVGHCFGGNGPAPVDPLAAVAAWVENGTAPDFLFASSPNLQNVTVSRNLCRFPQKITYVGGDVNVASSFTCV